MKLVLPQRFNVIICLALVAIFGTFASKAQVASYSFALTSGSYQPLSAIATGPITTERYGSGISGNAALDTASNLIVLPMPAGFNFNCRKINTIKIHPNGLIALNPLPVVNSAGKNIGNAANFITPTLAFAEGLLSPFFFNLNQSNTAPTGTTDSARISYALVNNDFVIEFKNVARNGAPIDTINFQVWLEASGVISYRYGNCGASPLFTTNSAIGVGLRGQSAGDFINIGFPATTGNWNTATVQTTLANSANYSGPGVTASPNLFPASGLTYSFIPASCATASYITIPASVNFDAAWSGVNNSRPTNNFINYPARGNNAWFRNDEIATNTGWTTATGAYTPTGANSTTNSARFHSIANPTSNSTTVANGRGYGDLDWYVDLSPCPSTNKLLRYYYINQTTPAPSAYPDTLFVMLSTDGGATFSNIDTVGSTAAAWTLRTINLGTVGTSTSIIRFRCTGGSGSSDFGIDEISVGTGGAPISMTVSQTSAIICSPGQGNSAVALTATSAGATSFNWSPTNGILPNPSSASITASPSITTVYTVQASDALCNTSSQTVTVNVARPIVLGVNANPPSVCPNTASTLTAIDTTFGPATITASYCTPTLGTTGATGYFVDNFSLGTLVNNTSGDGAIGCSLTGCDFSQYTPTATYFVGLTYPLSIKSGSFSASFGIWIDLNRDGDFVDANEFIYSTASPNNIVNTANILIPLSATPGLTRMRVLAKSSAVVSTNSCSSVPGDGEYEDYNIRIARGPSYPLSFSWAAAAQLVTSTGKTVTTTPINGTNTYTLTGTDANGCAGTTTVSVSSAPISNPTITATPLNVCPGSTVTLCGAATGGGGVLTYDWRNPSGVQIGNTQCINFPLPGSGTYSLTITDGCGFSTSTSIALTAAVLPVVTPQAGQPQICATSSPSVSVTMLPIGATFVWSPSTNVVPSSGAGPFVVTVAANTAYTVIGTDANGCTNSTTFLVLYRPNYPLFLRSTPAAVCPGGFSTLTATDTNYGVCNAPLTYCATSLHSGTGLCIDTVRIGSWIDASGTSCALPSYTASVNTTNVILSKTVAYSLQTNIVGTGFIGVWIDTNQDGTFANNEFFTDNINNPNHSIGLSFSSSAKVGCTRMRVRSRSTAIAAGDACATFVDGETHDYQIQLIETSYTSLNGYVWTRAIPNAAAAPVFTATSGNNISVGPHNNPPANPWVYVVTATDANGCSKQSTVAVTVAPLSCGTVTIGTGGNTVCLGDSRTLTINPTAGGQPYTYAWSGPGVTSNTNKTALATPTATGNSTYTVVVSDNCGSTCSATVVLTVNPKPVLAFNITNQPLCSAGTSVISLNATSNAATYTFTPALYLTPSATGPSTIFPITFTPGASTVYTVSGTSANSCTNSTTINIIFSPAYTLSPVASPNALGTCGGTVTLSVTDTITGPQILPAGPCPAGASFTSDEEIFGVTIGSMTNNTSNCAASNIGSAGTAITFANQLYADFTNINIGTVVPGQVIPFSINIGTCGGNFGSSTKIWVDYTRDGDFTDPGEEVFVTAGAVIGPHIVTGSFTVPSNITPGLTRLRVRNEENGNPLSLSSCGAASWGEVEDYAINLLATPLYPITTFAWTGPTPTTPTTGKVVTTTGLSSPTNNYTITATNTVGCSATGSTVVTLGSVAVPSIAVAPTSSLICAYSCATLTANTNFGSPPFTFVWSSSVPSSISVNNTPSIVACGINTTNVTSSQTYTVIVTDACGATSSKTVLLLVQPSPTLTVTSNPVSNVICATGSATFTPTGNATGYAWSAIGGSTVGAQTGNAYSVTPTGVLVNTYIVTASAANGCTRTSSVILNYSPTFNVVASANPTSVGCPTTITLSATDTAAGPQVLPTTPYCPAGASNTSDEEIFGFTIGSFSNATTNCTATNIGTAGTAGVFTNQLYADFSNLAPVATVVPGQNVSFIVDIGTCGGNFGSHTKIWIDYNRDGDFTDPQEEVFATTLSVNGPHSVIGSFVVPGSIVGGHTKLRIRNTETTLASALVPCGSLSWGEVEDYKIELLAAPQVPISSASGWVWNPGALPGKVVTTNSPTTPGVNIYTVTATNVLGCTTISTVSVTVQPLSCVTINATQNTICGGRNDTLVAVKAGGTAPYTYNWVATNVVAGGGINDSFVIINRPTLIATSSTYSVTISDACGASCSMTKLINFLPQPSITISSSVPVNGAICAPGNATLTAVTSGTTVNWSGTAGTFAPATGLTTTVTPTAAEVYTATASSANGCTNSTFQIVNFSPPMAVVATATPGNVGSCADTIQLNADVTFGFVAPPGSQYCFPPVTGAGAFKTNYGTTDQITNVTFPPINNTTIQDNVTLYPPAVGVPTINVATQYTMSITFGSDPAQNYRVWIDFNRDSVFDASESIGGGVVSGNATATITFTAPNSMGTGLARMRVRGGDDVAIPATFACNGSNSPWGELEDYYVDLVGITPPTIASYTWSSNPVTTIVPNPSQSPIAVLSGAATFTVTAVNSFGCVSTSTVIVTNAPFQYDSIAKGTQGTICEGQGILLTAKVRGGGQPYSVSWLPTTGLTSTTDTSIIATPPAPGITYTCTIIDGCGVSASRTVSIVVSPSPQITATPQLPSLCVPGTPDTIFTNCSAVCLSSSWAVPAGQPTIAPNTCNPVVSPTVAGPNSYTITCTNFLGCTKTAVATINVASAHTLVVSGQPSTVCYGDTVNLSLVDTALVTGPQVLPTYCTPSHSFASSCIREVAFAGINNITVPTCTVPSYSIFTQTATVVAGQTYNLTLLLSASSDVSVFIDFDGNGTFNQFNERIALGTVPGTPFAANITIPATATPGLVAMRIRSRAVGSPTNDPCIQYGSGETEDYRVNIIGYGPTVGSTYVWMPDTLFSSNIGATVTTLPLTGTTIFTINATDAANCTYSATKSIVVTPQILTAPAIVNNDCNGFQNGIIDVNASGGVGTLSVNLLPNIGIKGGFNLDSFYVLPSDTFQVVTTDNAGCVRRDTVTVTQPDELIVYYSTGGALCFGSSSACANIDSIKGGNNSGSISGHSIAWFDASSVQLIPPSYTFSNLNDTICGLGTGSYQLLVIDSKGCNTNPPLIPFTVSQPASPIAMTVTTVIPINCFGDSATIKVTGLGGVGNYKFSLNGGPYVTPLGGVDTFIYVLPQGPYTFSVQDGNSCNTSSVETITQPNALVIDSTIATNISCNGLNDGSIHVYASGGTNPLSYQLTGPIQTNGTGLFNSLSPNTYAVTVTDDNACPVSTSATLTEPVALAITNLSIIHDSCNGIANGSINIVFAGGTAPRIISISPTATGSNGNYTNLGPNTYVISCLDANGCVLSTSITITEPPLLVANGNITIPSSCAGNDALITVSATGGTPNLVAPLYTGTGNFSQASDTTITYTVTDANGCQASTTVVTTAPPGLTLTLTVDTAFKCANGYAVISLSATGGCGTYTGTFSNLQVTSVGQCFTVTSCGCSAVICDTMTKPTPVLGSITIITPALCAGDSVEVDITASGGTPPYSNVGLIKVPSGGVYTHTVTDANGCISTTSLNITAPTPVVIGVSTFAPIACAGGASTVTITASGGTGPYNGIGVFPLVGGPNFFTVEDAGGCPADTTLIVTEPTPIVSGIVVTDAPCGSANGTIGCTPSGGTPSYTVTINGTVVNNPSIAASYPVGSYTVDIVDQNGCLLTEIVQVLQGASFTLSATTPNPIVCFGDTTSLILSAVGGTAPFTGSTLGTQTLVAGTTSFTVNDGNGCPATISVTVTQPTEVIATAVVTPASCASGNLGSINPSATGGTGSVYTFLVDNAPVLANYAPGTYTVTASDVSGCIGTTVATITSIAVAPTVIFSNGSGSCSSNPMIVAGTYCQPLTGNQWYHFTTPSGQVYVSINPNGGSLGNVTATMYNTGAASLPTNTDLSGFDWNYMNKIWNLVADSATFSVPASVRFYYTAAELNALIATTACATCIDQDLVVSQLTGVAEDCEAGNNAAGQLNLFWEKNAANTGSELATVQTGATGNPSVSNYFGNINTGLGATNSANAALGGAYIEVTVDRFSEFRLHLPSSAPLSVTDLRLVGQRLGNTSLLTWSTASESNNSHFEIMHSTNGLDYKKVDEVKTLAPQGNSAAPLSYTYKHTDPSMGHNYYRLSQVDISGDKDNSNVVDVYFDMETGIIMYPNPTSDELHIDVTVQKASNITIKVMDVTGRLVKQIETELVKGANSSTISLGELTTGLYTIAITDGKGLNYTQQIKKQ